ncbi:hypothetical protein GCM10023080_018370 [Streptomyces pseudoechinosporeus]
MRQGGRGGAPCAAAPAPGQAADPLVPARRHLLAGPRLTIGDVLRNAASTAPDRLALIEIAPPGADRTWTYAQLLDDAEHAASWLATRFAPGERIAVWVPGIPEWVILQYGAAMAGLVLVTVSPALRDG